jgi:type I restriction-modification system DNA methylase subunit
MPNERKTEKIVRNKLEQLGYYDSTQKILVEEQQSDIPKIHKMLKNASKKGSGGGYPEFIITSEAYPELLIVIECKADIHYHQSNTLDRFSEYAVDGSLLYASFLAKEYDVIAIGISGIVNKEIKITHHLFLKGQTKYESFLADNLLSFHDYYTSFIQSPSKFSEDYKSLLGYSQTLNSLLHSNKIKESQRSLLISGILIALKNGAFKAGYKKHKTARNLSNNLVTTIINELSNINLPQTNIESLKTAFNFIEVHTTLITDKTFLEDLITSIDVKLNSFLQTHKYFDVLGQFYIEFLRYANNDKGLGIVLTPPHITDLFADLAGINKNSVVLDTCCGSGGFLISAMKKMVNDAYGDSQKIAEIKNGQIVGIEFQDDIYALAITNMVIHGDGKSNVIQGDCFKLVGSVGEEFKPTVGLLNPPYASQKNDTNELRFVQNNLEMLERNAKCIAIVPMSCATADSGVDLQYKELLLKQHTLEAVMSMPEDLFHDSNANIVTCVMVFTAHTPHPKGKKTWFGYWRNDGFVKKKNLGRIDNNNTWGEIKEHWVNSFFNREIRPQQSISWEVSANDEWCAEPYLDTDYTTLCEAEFIKTSLAYLSFLASMGDIDKLRHFINGFIELLPKPITNSLKVFQLSDLFKIKSGENRLVENNAFYSGVPIISATTSNNGFSHFTDEQPLYNGNSITIANTGQASVGVAFYQPYSFSSTNNINILEPKLFLNEYIGMFLVTIFKIERYRFSYGRVLNLNRTNSMKIKLPVDNQGNPDWLYMENYIKTLPIKQFKRIPIVD